VIGNQCGFDAGRIAYNWDERRKALTSDFVVFNEPGLVNTKLSKSTIISKRFCDDPAASIVDGVPNEVQFPDRAFFACKE